MWAAKLDQIVISQERYDELTATSAAFDWLVANWARVLSWPGRGFRVEMHNGGFHATALAAVAEAMREGKR